MWYTANTLETHGNDVNTKISVRMTNYVHSNHDELIAYIWYIPYPYNTITITITYVYNIHIRICMGTIIIL